MVTNRPPGRTIDIFFIVTWDVRRGDKFDEEFWTV